MIKLIHLLLNFGGNFFGTIPDITAVCMIGYGIATTNTPSQVTTYLEAFGISTNLYSALFILSGAILYKRAALSVNWQFALVSPIFYHTALTFIVIWTNNGSFGTFFLYVALCMVLWNYLILKGLVDGFPDRDS